ncbi:hypothetical protein [Methanobrevibacter sp.]|uniref:hypothetical protein n=1 Tax=Methanobrevibacter sp. TaxID=66852 RepID=UPI00388FBA6D
MGKNKESNKNTKNVKKDEEKDNLQHIILTIIFGVIFVFLLYTLLTSVIDVSNKEIVCGVIGGFVLWFVFFYDGIYKKMADYWDECEIRDECSKSISNSRQKEALLKTASKKLMDLKNDAEVTPTQENVKKDEEKDNLQQDILTIVIGVIFVISLYTLLTSVIDVPKEIVCGVIGGFVLLFVFFYYGNNKQEKSLSKDNVDNTIKTLDKLNMLKQSGAISDNDYDAMKKGLLSENNHKSQKHILVIVLIILGGIFFIYNLGSYSSEDEGACYTLLVKKATHRAERYSTDLIKNVTSSIERSGHCKLNYTIFKGNGLLFYNGFGGSSRPTYWCIKNKEGRYKVYIDEDRIDIDSKVLNSVGESGKNLCQAYESLINLYSFWDPWTRIVD